MRENQYDALSKLIQESIEKSKCQEHVIFYTINNLIYVLYVVEYVSKV